MRSFLPVILLLAAQAAMPGSRLCAQPALQGQALLQAALKNEAGAAQDPGHPMRFVLRKTSPRLTTEKLIFETRDGAVARLVSTNDRPLSPADEQKERSRLDGLLKDPAKQQRSKQRQDADLGRVLKVLRVLPQAFLYQDAGPLDIPGGTVQKFTFTPNPAFDPPDLETQVLTAMAGELWIDPKAGRVVRLEGHLQQDVNFMWGILGKLNKGGWIRLEQADVGDGQWRTVRLQMVMTARLVWRTRVLDTTQVQSQFQALPAEIGYREAIKTLTAREPAPRQ